VFLHTVLLLADTVQSLQDAVQAANALVYSRSRTVPGQRGMGTTLVALLLKKQENGIDRRLWLAHVGDSRCYRLRAGELTQLTRDHSLVADQVRAGQLTEEQAERSPMRNIITRSIGSSLRVEAEIQSVETQVGDLYLLASDGLTRELSDEDLRGPLGTDVGLESICLGLVNCANAAGGNDNITVLLVRIEE